MHLAGGLLNQRGKGPDMNWKLCTAWLLMAVFCVGPLAGCKPVDKKSPDQPKANTTDSK
jgi:hypothetical protein